MLKVGCAVQFMSDSWFCLDKIPKQKDFISTVLEAGMLPGRLWERAFSAVFPSLTACGLFAPISETIAT